MRKTRRTTEGHPVPTSDRFTMWDYVEIAARLEDVEDRIGCKLEDFLKACFGNFKDVYTPMMNDDTDTLESMRVAVGDGDTRLYYNMDEHGNIDVWLDGYGENGDCIEVPVSRIGTEYFYTKEQCDAAIEEGRTRE